MNRYLIIFSVLILITGCAHRYTESEYKTVETQLSVCEQACAVVSQDNKLVKTRIAELEEELKKSKIDKDQCLQDMQGLLDRNLEALQYNKTLLQQMTSYKTIIQERTDTRSRSVKAYEYTLNLLDKEREGQTGFHYKK